MNESLCPKCGHVVLIGEYPFCPHGTGCGQVIDDTLTGGARWMHNLGERPVWIEKRSELKKIMAERGLVSAEKNSYAKDDKSPYASRTRLRPGQRDPFIQRA